jgi:hypothetical protein
MHISIRVCERKLPGTNLLTSETHGFISRLTHPPPPDKFEVRLSIEEHNATVLTPPPRPNPIRLHDVVSGQRGENFAYYLFRA